jgi:hypothetical protein
MTHELAAGQSCDQGSLAIRRIVSIFTNNGIFKNDINFTFRRSIN